MKRPSAHHVTRRPSANHRTVLPNVSAPCLAVKAAKGLQPHELEHRGDVLPCNMDTILNQGSNLTYAWHAHGMTGPKPPVRIHLPTAREVELALDHLGRSSCAVVGAAASLLNCSLLDSLCSADVIIRVNDHKPVGTCNRTDVQVANQYTCREPLSKAHEGPPSDYANQSHQRVTWIGLKSSRPCLIRPSLFRLRFEWGPNPSPNLSPRRTEVAKANRRKWASSKWAAMRRGASKLGGNPWLDDQATRDHFADGAWLLSKNITRYAHEQVAGRRSSPKEPGVASAGGVAIAFALRACASVQVFGIGSSGGYAGNENRTLGGSDHNWHAERSWIAGLVRDGRVRRIC